MSDPVNAADGDDPSDYRPRAQRANVMLMARVERLATAKATTHRVRDLSAGGIRIDNGNGLQAGTIVLVTVGALQAVRATVSWVRNGFAGLAFAKAINVEEARTKAAIAAEVTAKPYEVKPPGTIASPTAGWVSDMRNSYRK